MNARSSSGSVFAWRRGVTGSMYRCLLSFATSACLLACASAVLAQEPPAEHHHESLVVSERVWRWTADANVFAGYNDQQRHFADFTSWESQNWVMGSGERAIGSGTLRFDTMLSLEPFTIHASWRIAAVVPDR